MSSQANLFDALVTTVTLGVHTETQSSGAEEGQGRHAEPQKMSPKRAKKLGVKETLVQVNEEGLPKEVRRQVVCRPVSVRTYVDDVNVAHRPPDLAQYGRQSVGSDLRSRKEMKVFGFEVSGSSPNLG